MHRRTALLAVLGLSLLASRRHRRPPQPTSRRRTAATTTTPRWWPRSRTPKPTTRPSSTSSSIGKSYQNRNIWAAKVSDNVADDENEPEVLFDGLHHAREHLTVEQTGDPALAERRLRHGHEITKLVDTREIWIIFNVNPDGGEYDLTGSPYRAGARTASRTRARPRWHRPQPQLRLSLGLLRRLVGLEVLRHLSRLEGVLRPETRVARLHQQSGVGGASRSRPRSRSTPPARKSSGRTATPRRCPRHDRRRPRRARRDRQADGRVERLHAEAVELAVCHRRRRDRLGIRRAPDLHVHLRDVSIEGLDSTISRFYPPDEVITARRTATARPSSRSSAAPAACTRRSASPVVARPVLRRLRGADGLEDEPVRDRHRDRGRWVRATRRPRPIRRSSGSRAMVTGYKPGRSAVVRRRRRRHHGPLDADHARVDGGQPDFRYYLAHGSNSSSEDSFEAYVEDEAGP